eukprot:2070390-Amphidinium_carterae.2
MAARLRQAWTFVNATSVEAAAAQKRGREQDESDDLDLLLPDAMIIDVRKGLRQGLLVALPCGVQYIPCSSAYPDAAQQTQHTLMLAYACAGVTPVDPQPGSLESSEADSTYYVQAPLDVLLKLHSWLKLCASQMRILQSR